MLRSIWSRFGLGRKTLLKKSFPSLKPHPLSPKTFAFIESLFAALLRRGLPLGQDVLHSGLRAGEAGPPQEKQP